MTTPLPGKSHLGSDRDCEIEKMESGRIRFTLNVGTKPYEVYVSQRDLADALEREGILKEISPRRAD